MKETDEEKIRESASAALAVENPSEAISENLTSEEDFSNLPPDGEKPLDKNVRLMSPARMVLRRFFRSKLSIVGLVMIVALILFSWFGPVVYRAWGEIEADYSINVEYNTYEVKDDEGNVLFYEVVETQSNFARYSYPSARHILGTDLSGFDVFARLMYGGRISLTVSFLAVIVISILGIIFGGIAGYFGGKVDSVIMRFCDILMCLPGLPIILIVGTVLQANQNIPSSYHIYLLIMFLTLISWPGTARLVRGQILSLREQEYMVAADAMGYSAARKIFKHLVPNVLPQLIVSMTLSLGSMILYEATLSFLGLGVQAPYAAWGTMINATSNDDVLRNYFNIWGPPGICIIIAVLGFNFLGDGLRDALDPKMRR